MVVGKFVNLLYSLFGLKKNIRLGIYGAVNSGKTTLANRISVDWTGDPVGKASIVPHETRFVQKKEKVEIKLNKKKLSINLLDMPGIATKVDYKTFLKYKMTRKDAKQRAKEATDGIVEAIKWLNHVDTVLAVMDATQDPLTQVNITLLGNLEARKIPVVIVANKIDKKKANPNAIKEAFPQYPMVSISALKGKNMNELYEAIEKHSRGS
jgi:small GTP-binding protein